MEIKSLLKNKKGMGIGDMYPVILTIAVVALLIAIVLLVLDEFGTQTAESSPESGSIANETHEFGAAIIAVALNAEGTNCSAHNFAVSVVENETANYIINSANYSVNSDTGIVTNLTGTFPFEWKISYSWDYGGTSCVVTRDVIDDISDFIPWIGVILLIIAAAIVLGILIRSLGSGSSRV